MKTLTLFTALSFVAASAAALCTLSPARADADAELGTWEGDGTTSDRDGKATTPFHVTVVRKAAAAGVIRTEGRVVLEGGRAIPFWQEATARGQGRFQLTSDRGAGGGICFANGMCQWMVEQGGHAAATTTAKTADGKLSVVVTELENGRAVRFHAQTLTRR